MPVTDQITDAGFRNWIRASLGLKNLKEGLVGFIENKAHRQYEKCVKQVKQKTGIADYTCNTCSFDTLLPHNPSNPNRRGNIQKRPCPQRGACGIFYDLVAKEHTETAPKWRNANFDQWSSSHVEFIKCFISTSGYKEKKSFEQLDALALLQICRNNRSLHATLFDQSFQNLVDSVSFTIVFILFINIRCRMPHWDLVTLPRIGFYLILILAHLKTNILLISANFN